MEPETLWGASSGVLTSPPWRLSQLLWTLALLSAALSLHHLGVKRFLEKHLQRTHLNLYLKPLVDSTDEMMGLSKCILYLQDISFQKSRKIGHFSVKIFGALLNPLKNVEYYSDSGDHLSWFCLSSCHLSALSRGKKGLWLHSGKEPCIIYLWRAALTQLNASML